MNADNNTITIPLSKTKVVLLTVGAIVFMAIGFWLWSSADAQNRYNPTLVRLMAVNSFAFFGLCGIIGFRKLVDNRPGLVLNEFGITDNSSATGVYTIKWSDIRGVKIEEVKRTKFLLIYLKNPQDYIDKANLLKKFWMKLNYRVHGTPLSITSTTLKCTISDLMNMIESQRKKYSA